VAIYHLHVKNISRGDGRSAVAAAAYRAGETLPNQAEERDSAFGGRRDVVYAEIILPAGAPAWMADRARLWNGAEAAERRKDARLAKEIEFALPRELPRAMWLPVAHEMADAFATRGHVVDLALHDDGAAHNPHVHLMLTTRAVSPEGFGGKMREADGKKFVIEVRAMWAQIANTALGKVGAAVQVDARSHAARGDTATPGRHRGPNPAERRARREQRRKEQEIMGRELDDTDALPVPDADGRPITQRELDEAQERMIAEVERPADEVPHTPRPQLRDPPQVRITERRDELAWRRQPHAAASEPSQVKITERSNDLAWRDSTPARDERDRDPERER
jgi:ATP-dependent exoDNAse (exonuclease V) alpha subunit